MITPPSPPPPSDPEPPPALTPDMVADDQELAEAVDALIAADPDAKARLYVITEEASS